ncbi:MAG TPA: DUF3830 family protein [Candidatus Limnocylindria bacterium]|nr:DUF3830 family protein [Candidatus Limnocylindria bacterium]
MTKRIRIVLDGSVECEAALFEDKAPRTVASLWRALPIEDRTIQVRWSGNAWRTDGNYELLPKDAPVENVADRLAAGDVIYYPGYHSGLIKIGMAYGGAKWYAPFARELDVALIGKIDEGLEAFTKRCENIILEGPLSVRMSRIE